MKLVAKDVAFNVRVFLVLDTDGESPAEGLVNGDFTSKRFAIGTDAFADLTGAITEAENGWYTVPVSVGEADAYGDVQLHLEAPGIMALDRVVAQVVGFDPESPIATSSALGEIRNSQVVEQGTAQSGAAGMIQLAAGAVNVLNALHGCRIRLTGGTGAGQVRSIFFYDNSDKTADVYPDWIVVPDNTTTYEVYAQGDGSSPDAFAFAQIAANRLPAVLVGGRVDASVGAMQNDTITGAALAASAVTEIISGLMAFSHRAGRTILGWIRRSDAVLANEATGLKGPTATFLQPDGTTTELSGDIDNSGNRTNIDVTNSEVP
mgnify:CR=1 FL=1